MEIAKKKPKREGEDMPTHELHITLASSTRRIGGRLIYIGLLQSGGR